MEVVRALSRNSGRSRLPKTRDRLIRVVLSVISASNRYHAKKDYTDDNYELELGNSGAVGLCREGRCVAMSSQRSQREHWQNNLSPSTEVQHDATCGRTSKNQWMLLVSLAEGRSSRVAGSSTSQRPWCFQVETLGSSKKAPPKTLAFKCSLLGQRSVLQRGSKAW